MFGLTEFASNSSAFDDGEIRCVLKRLYSDFIVIEIPSDGHVLKPNSAAQAPQNGAAGTECEKCQESETTTTTVPPADDGKAEKPTRLTDQQFDQMQRVADGTDEEGKMDIDLKDWSKEERKNLYQFIRANFDASALDTECVDGQLTVRRMGTNGRSSTKRWSQWPKGRGDFVHFTMVKRNMDSQAAVHLIARNARLKPSMLALSGTKDRRAVTAQRVSAFRVEPGRLESAARSLRGIWLRDFCYASAPLRLGDACGNRFNVILRDVDALSVDTAQLSARIAQWTRDGFLNYFGTQRFGTCGVDTAHIGRLLLSEQWEAATAALLAPRAEANGSLNACLRCYAGSSANASAALKMLERSNASAGATVERALLSALAKCPAGHKAAILALHRDMRTMYIHAYQSLVFNTIVSRRKKTFGLAVLDGDLGADGEVLEQGSAIERVCLPLPSLEGTKMPKNDVAQWYSEIAAQDGIQCAQFAKLERQFALGSCYRPFLVRPANVEWELLHYARDTEELQHCEFIPSFEQEGHGKEEENDKMRMALKICFDLPSGAYATVALRELMRTDFGKKAQKQLEEEMMRKRRRTTTEEAEEEEKGGEKEQKKEEQTEMLCQN
ncbi:hypothetical protein niasHT_001942 [Heterodera trifolii]|uniref:TRUD domain-containing protein n=1 Tax=Heterodera trifolii TaxID=157864 RepID=A0ABD2M349_9BILA